MDHSFCLIGADDLLTSDILMLKHVGHHIKAENTAMKTILYFDNGPSRVGPISAHIPREAWSFGFTFDRGCHRHLAGRGQGAAKHLNAQDRLQQLTS